MAVAKESAIMQLAASCRSSRVAAAEFDGEVSVWDLETRKRISYVDTPLDFGGQRLAINSEGDHYAIASWAYNGVACYHAESGEVVWARQKLKQPQFITYSPCGKRLYCGGERRPCAVLDADTGADLASYPATDKVYCSEFQPLELLEKRGKRKLELRETGSRRVAAHDAITFFVLDAAFGPDRLCVSESSGPVRCFETGGSPEIWRYSPAKGKHILTLGYSRAASAFFGVEYSYQKGGPKQLLRFDSATGKSSPGAKKELDSETEVFCKGGDALLTSRGVLIDLLTGKSKAALRFPTIRR